MAGGGVTRRLKALEQQVGKIAPGEQKRAVLMVPLEDYEKALALAGVMAHTEANGDLAESDLRSLD